jgi:putative transposase
VQVKKAFKFRIYPNQAQREALSVQFGHARFVYNHYRAVREGYYLDTGTGLAYRDCADDLADILKVEHPWLKEADSQVLQQALKDLDRAYINFFAGRADYPNFKSKHDKQSIRYPQRFKVNGNKLYLPKVGWVKTVFHRPIEGAPKGHPKNCTVSKTKTGKYFVSIQCEMEVEDPQPKPFQVGIDLGLKTFATLSTGEKFDKPKYLHRSERRLKIRQRRLSRKVKGSNSRDKARHRVAVQHERIANQRKDFHHKLSHRLASEYGCIAFESLNTNGMLKNHSLAKAIADAGWSQFVNLTAYKALWAGGGVRKVDRFFPSSKLCSDCGDKHHHLTLNVRQWVCLNCGVFHDRDENAAINILKQATVGATESYAAGDTRVQVRLSAPEAQQL